ncbi:MAG TPA: hypothetical protein PLQ88_16430, partial [Blastocatellia bacterium]|nr:hypothetical protein [Blastocatellia bacterium]
MKALKRILSTVFLTITIFAAASAQTLLGKKFTATAEAEALLDLTASSPGTSWLTAGAEAATATIFVDGRKHQDVILFSGAKPFTYKLLLGHVAAGEHSLRIDFNREQSAAKATTINIADAKVTLLDRTQPEFQAVAHTPFLFARANTIGKFSDVPLLMYYETVKEGALTTYRYTVIISNEDGGTQTAALMARWGRTTDIEWVVDVQVDAQGKVVNSTYQGVQHETKTFQGKREADHPLFLIKSDNNNFADDGESPMRFTLRPVGVDLSKHSREWVMDQHPWTHTIMAEEMTREGKITAERTLGARIADLRTYLYVDVASNQENGALLSFALKLKNDPKWYTSDLGIGYYKIERSGYFRTTIRLPQGVTPDKIERLSARCDLTGNPRSKEEISKASAARCELNAINSVFLLDERFQPGRTLPIRTGNVTLPFGESVEIRV